MNAEWLLGGGAVGLDAASLTIRLHGGQTVTADGIVIATGARACQIPELAGLDNVFYLRTMADAQGLTPRLVAGARMIVIGAGFIGAEVASSAASRGMDVTTINNSAVPFTAQLGHDMGSVVAKLHAGNGVNLVCGTVIGEFHRAGNSATGLRLADGRELAADVVVVGIGAEPNVEWLTGSGVEVDGGVLCDAMGRTQRSGHSAGYDRLEIEAGDPQEHNFLAVYYRGGDAVAVLGMNQPRLFTKWRRGLVLSAPKPSAAAETAAATVP